LFGPRNIQIIKGTKSSIKVYNGGNIEVIGKVELKCQRRDKSLLLSFLVVKNSVQTIIGCQDSQKFGFIKVLVNDLATPGNEVNILEVDIDDYNDLFIGKG